MVCPLETGFELLFALTLPSTPSLSQSWEREGGIDAVDLGGGAVIEGSLVEFLSVESYLVGALSAAD
jgi:hypothetical protein